MQTIDLVKERIQYLENEYAEALAMEVHANELRRIWNEIQWLQKQEEIAEYQTRIEDC
ncbi:MAG TPA: hypothetical protein VGC29_08675 [Flavisolibacter sp.]